MLVRQVPFPSMRMNMLMHGVDYHNFDIYKGDTLTNDYYEDEKMTVQVCPMKTAI